MKDLVPITTVCNYVLNYEYIKNNLCEDKNVVESTCHGKCFLIKRISKQTKIKKQSDSINSFEWQNQILIYQSKKGYSLIFKATTHLNNTFIFKSNRFNSLYLSPDSPPPIV